MATYAWRSGVNGSWGNAALWTGGQVPNAASAAVTIAAPGTYTVTLAGGEAFTVGSLLLNGTGALLSIAGLLHLNGTLTVKAGRVELHRGTIQGGTIVGDGSELGFGLEPLNTLDGVTVRGGLNLDGNAIFTHGTKVVAANGTSPGALTLGTLQGSTLQIIGAQTLHNIIQLKNYSQIVASASLTLASDTRVSGDGSVGVDLTATAATLTNQGIITADQAGQRLDVTGAKIANSGTLATVNGATLSIAGALTNTGTITAAGGTLQIGTLQNNSTGTITATNAEIDLGNATTATLGTFSRTGGTLLVTGTIDNTGQNLDLTQGRLARLNLGGAIHGGTLTHPSGLGLVYAYKAQLDGVTVLGDVTVQGGGLRLSGTAVRNAANTAPGMITVNGQTLILQGTQTLHGTVQLQAGAVLAAGDYGIKPGADTLTIAADASIAGAGAIKDGLFLGESGGQGLFVGPATVVNEGVITATGQTLTVSPNIFTNTGSLGTLAGATLTVAPTHFSNFNHGTLDGGSYLSSGLLQLRSDAALTTIGGTSRTDVQLDRAGQLASWDTAASIYRGYQDTLTTIGTHGNLSLAIDTVFAHPLVNNGTLSVFDGPKTIKAPSLTNSAGATLLLWGTLDAPLINNGVVTATEASKITGAVTGTGELDLGSVSTLELASIGTQTIKFMGAGATLKLDAPGAYTGQIQGFTRQQIIDLAGIQADRASFSQGVLTLYKGAASVDRLNLAGAFTNEIFEVKADGTGGTAVKVNDLPVTTVPASETVTAGSTTALAGISIADADARFPDELFTVRISDITGHLTANPGTGQAAVTGANSTALTVTGGLLNVNEALATLTYTAGPAGSDTIRLLTSDGRGGTDTHSIGITIAPH